MTRRRTGWTRPRWLFPASRPLCPVCAAGLIVQGAGNGRTTLLVVGSLAAAPQVAGLVLTAVRARRGRQDGSGVPSHGRR